MISGCLTCVGYVVSSQASLLSVFAPFLIFCSGMYIFEIVFTLLLVFSVLGYVYYITTMIYMTMYPQSFQLNIALTSHSLCYPT